MKFTAMTAAVAVALSAVATLPAAAEEVQINVSYADINLASEAGAATLAGRVKSAVDAACERPAARDLKRFAEWQQCRATAQENAYAQLNQQGVAINP